ncbi:N-acetylglucosamine kinase [Frigoriglobus tundricola]|uniref:N-acetylglucosamine kinase of eukaryotic type n=1 Tax=Frigoriglobus tundricola TaxID=2774151 RepID=A0A6M5YHW7_9BACT|nr:BadF/BadG/BcrA/BcrD ATPase family protein [Frigoriglobus tundricola]QJW93647.1 N-acetylglucosamine kinase of eukaryotic type [Frigoriglobus tundricola]
MAESHSFVIGIDGGASHTAAVLADARRRTAGARRGRTVEHPGGRRGVPLRELDAAVAEAFRAANLPRTPVGAAALGLAGVDLNEGLDIIRGWSDRVQLAERLSVANDATLLFAAGTPDGWGLAIIAGTGSIAFALDAHGRDARAGGWGYLLGDEGSAFRVGLLGLRAACRAADAIGEPTALLPVLLGELGSTDARDLIPAVYRGKWDKAAIAGLAPLVLNAAAAGDRAATAIFEQEARELARTAAGAVAAGDLPRDGVPLALTGGMVIENAMFRDRFLRELRACGVTPDPVGLVDDPVVGAVVLARKLLIERPAPAGW